MNAKDRIIIRTFNDVVTELRTVASEIGGDHLPSKEAESVIKTIADKLAELIWETAERISDTNEVFGVPNSAIEEYKREKNKKARECLNCSYSIQVSDGSYGCFLAECHFLRKGENND